MRGETVRLRVCAPSHFTENKTEQTRTIKLHNNRLDPSTFKADAFDRILQRLVVLVPALTGGEHGVSDAEVKKAISKATAEAIVALTDSARRRSLGAAFQLRTPATPTCSSRSCSVSGIAARPIPDGAASGTLLVCPTRPEASPARGPDTFHAHPP